MMVIISRITILVVITIIIIIIIIKPNMLFSTSVFVLYFSSALEPSQRFVSGVFGGCIMNEEQDLCLCWCYTSSCCFGKIPPQALKTFNPEKPLAPKAPKLKT